MGALVEEIAEYSKNQMKKFKGGFEPNINQVGRPEDGS